MKRKVTRSLVVLCICLAVLFVTACSESGNNNGATNSEPKPQETKKSDVTLTVMASQDQIMDAEIELAKSFEEETGIKIDYQIVPSDQFPNLINAKLNSGEGPDIIVAQGGKLTLKASLDPERNLEDLSAEPWVSKMIKPFEEGVSYNGKVYGLPLWDLGGSSSWVLVYNKKIFADLGLTPPTTYDELLSVSQTLLDNGITPIYEAGSDGWHHQLPLMEMGPRVEELNAGFYEQLNQNQTTLQENADMLKLVEQIKELVDRGYYGEEYYSNMYADNYNAMASGKYAMTIDRSNFGSELVANVADSPYGEDDFSAVPMPFLDNQILNVNPQGPSKFVYKDGKHVAEAKQFLAYLAEPDHLQYFLDHTPRFSELPFEGVTPKPNKTLEEIKAVATKEGVVMQAGVSYVDPQWMDIGQDLMALFTGAAEPIDVLKNMDNRRSQQAKALNDPAWSN